MNNSYPWLLRWGLGLSWSDIKGQTIKPTANRVPLPATPSTTYTLIHTNLALSNLNGQAQYLPQPTLHHTTITYCTYCIIPLPIVSYHCLLAVASQGLAQTYAKYHMLYMLYILYHTSDYYILYHSANYHILHILYDTAFPENFHTVMQKKLNLVILD